MRRRRKRSLKIIAHAQEEEDSKIFDTGQELR
jgi:hypothetical protein